MEELRAMKEALMGCAQGQIYGNLEQVDAKELGEVIDMIKDLAETEYYCSIVEAMEEGSDRGRGSQYPSMYSTRYPSMYNDPRRAPMDPRMKGMPMYSQGGSSRGMRGYSEGWIPYEEPYHMSRDPREGRSGEHRKMYMEGKGIKDKAKQMQELEAYMQELSSDVTEMIQDASPEEKQMLQQKIITLANKIK